MAYSSMIHKSILTKEILQHSGWKGDTCCQFCGLEETIDHLFVQCPLARFLWNIVTCAFNLPPLPFLMGTVDSGLRWEIEETDHGWGCWLF